MIGDIWCDPPQGYLYGFPKKVSSKETYSREWLIANGYPAEEIEKYGEYFHVRFWKDDDNEHE